VKNEEKKRLKKQEPADIPRILKEERESLSIFVSRCLRCSVGIFLEFVSRAGEVVK
jgi:hypothetical protein